MKNLPVLAILLAFLCFPCFGKAREVNDCTPFVGKRDCRKMKKYGCKWKKKKCIQKPNVFFIGNSFTVFRPNRPVSDMPKMFRMLAKKSKKKLWEAESYASGGSWLEDHAHNNALVNHIVARNRSYLVMQEQSVLLARGRYNWERTTLSSAKELAEKAAEKGIKVMLYETWGYDWTEPGYSNFQEALHEGYTALAELLGAELCPVGQVWARAVAEMGNDARKLYYYDYKHPSHLGHYLVASSFYACIFNESPVGIPWVPKYIDKADADFVRQLVEDVILGE